jgi:hypothetical protein
LGTDFYGQYRLIDPHEEVLGNLSMIQFSGLDSLRGGVHQLVFVHGSGYSKRVGYYGSEMSGLIISVDAPGNYEVEVYTHDGDPEGKLCHGLSSVFRAGADPSLFDNVELCGWLAQLTLEGIIGIGAALIVAVLVIIFGVIWCRRHPKREQNKDLPIEAYGRVANDEV